MDVIAFGTVFFELVFGHVDHLPGPGEEIYTDQFATSVGGTVSIASAARDSGASAGLATVLSDDLGSMLVERHCVQRGIDTSGCVRVAGRTSGITVVLNFDEDRSFVSHLPRGTGQETLDGAQWWAEVIRRQMPTWIYLHARPGLMGFLHQARAAGCRIALDTESAGIESYPEAVLECISAADLFIPNSAEIRQLTGSADLEGALAALGGMTATVVVKQGPLGAVLAHQGQIRPVTAGLRAVEVVDRTGAGDAFAGAVIGVLAQGGELVEAVVAGNGAGSDAVARLGALGEVNWEEGKRP